MYFDWTMLLMIPGLLLGLWAQFRVKNAFHEYSQVSTRSGLTAEQVCHMLVGSAKNGAVQIGRIAGNLTDHYDPGSNVLRLSDSVYGSSSVAAVGVAAHECGHALQQHGGYLPLKVRSAIVPVVNIGSHLYFPIFFAGILFSWQPLMHVGIFCFALTLLFSLVTLPVELDASRRALGLLSSCNVMDQWELEGVRKVLNAAALTYVASAVSSALQLFRLLLIARSRED
ncbi:MAG: zinc metallopeptidase [Clostridiales bacterium]|nr:zinc metallopeptidase [Clostridiales bacterium]